MSRGEPQPTDSSETSSFFPRSTSTVSLDERFSQVLVDQRSRSRSVTFDPVMLRQQEGCVPPQTLLLVETQRSRSLRLPRSGRGNVWTRLGWHQGTSRPPGFWSFMNKYRWRTSFASTCRSEYLVVVFVAFFACSYTCTCASCSEPGNIHRRLRKRRLVRMTKIHKMIRRTHLQMGGVISSGRRCMSKGCIPTKQQLDAQLDEYMSMTKSRLDAQLDEYMSMTKSRLDAELDDYMSMTGPTNWD
ncbi:chromatin target of PRMT1b isoform X1 [Gasterosteus aculeatus]